MSLATAYFLRATPAYSLWRVRSSLANFVVKASVLTSSDYSLTDPFANRAICVDGGDASKKAFDWVLNHVHRTKDSIVVLHVSELVQTQIAHPSPFYVNLQDQLNDELRKQARVILEYYDAKLKECGISHQIEELSGPSAKELIVAFTAERDVDHLVLGRRSMSSQERKLVGSTTDYCTPALDRAEHDGPMFTVFILDLGVHHAHANVMIVK